MGSLELVNGAGPDFKNSTVMTRIHAGVISNLRMRFSGEVESNFHFVHGGSPLNSDRRSSIFSFPFPPCLRVYYVFATLMSNTVDLGA
jgi:hypothetical protein